MAAEAANGWQCTKCTYINEAEGATVCEMCGEGTRPAGKGKGRLRARSPANPPLISSFADTLNEEHESSTSRSSGSGRTNTRSRSGRSLKPATVREEEEEGQEEEEEQEEDKGKRRTTAGSTTRTRTRTRSSSRGAKQQQQQQQDTEKHDPLVIDDSDHDQSERQTEGVSRLASGDDEDDDNDDDDSGETPLLLGRGWSAYQRGRAKRRKLSRGRDQASNGAGKGSGSAAAARRKKRQRPLPAHPGGDLFRDRAYRVEDDDGDALPPTLNLPAVDGGKRPFWRWPPPPAAMAVCEQRNGTMSPGRSGLVSGQGGDKRAANGDGDVDLPVVSAGGCSGDGGGREGALEMKTERLAAVGALPPATQEHQKSRKR